jgi:glycosyltransferase involved in cell wall biosynthesis
MTERARVMLLLSSLNGGGAERVAVHLVNRCDPDIVDVRIGLLNKTGPFLADADPTRIDVAPIAQNLLTFEGHNSSFYRPDRLAAAIGLAPLNIRRMIDDHRPHVVMSFLKGMSLLTWLVINAMGRNAPRWVAREGNNTDAVIDDELANPLARVVVKGLTRRAYRRADCFLANSHEMADGLREALALNSFRIRVIHNPIDVAMVRRRANEPLPQVPARPFIVTAGRLEYQKGHDVLLKAFAASQVARDMDLVILGRGTLEQSLRRQAADLGVADRVRFPGFTDNPWAWIAKAELFVLPSRWEGFPSVVAETLACAAPALVTACDFGPREVVEHGRSGWVVPPDDVGAFGAAMDMLLRRPDLTQQFRRNGPARAASFDIDEMVDAYTDLFLEQAEAGLVPAARRARPRRSALRARTATSG